MAKSGFVKPHIRISLSPRRAAIRLRSDGLRFGHALVRKGKPLNPRSRAVVPPGRIACWVETKYAEVGHRSTCQCASRSSDPAGACPWRHLRLAFRRFGQLGRSAIRTSCGRDRASGHGALHRKFVRTGACIHSEAPRRSWTPAAPHCSNLHRVASSEKTEPHPNGWASGCTEKSHKARNRLEGRRYRERLARALRCGNRKAARYHRPSNSTLPALGLDNWKRITVPWRVRQHLAIAQPEARSRKQLNGLSSIGHFGDVSPRDLREGLHACPI
jgi:hypothetical protein